MATVTERQWSNRKRYYP